MEGKQTPLDFRGRVPESSMAKGHEFPWRGSFEGLVEEYDKELEKALDRGYRVAETVERFGRRLTHELEKALGKDHELSVRMRQATQSKDQGKVFGVIHAVKELWTRQMAA